MGSEFLAKFDEMVARFKKEFNDIIEKEREKMKAEVEAYNAEKERLQTVSVRDDDIIHLNVSGLKLTTNRSTLCQVEGSLLASMFSGRWEDSVQRDQDGAVFLDFNPQHFTVILACVPVHPRSEWTTGVDCNTGYCYLGLSSREENCESRKSRTIT